jgi:O-antigen ligase
MPQTRKHSQIDWGLFLAFVLGAKGFHGLVPGLSGRLFTAVTTVVLAALVFRQLNQSLSILLSRRIIALTAVWMVISSLLATRPVDSLAATSTAVLLILYATAVGRERPIADILQTIAFAGLVSMAPSVVGLIVPVGGIRAFWGAGSSGGYAGYFSWNSSAGYCAGATLICIVTLYFRGARHWWHLPTAASALLLLFLGSAAAPLAALLGAGAAMFGSAALRRFGPWSTSLLAIGLGVPLMIVYNLGELLSLSNFTAFFGRADNLSGRTDIWLYASDLLAQSPLFGYGSGGIWDSSRDWGYSSANNGYFEAALRWGLPVALALIAIILLGGFRLVTSSGSLLPLWTLGVIANTAVSQLTMLTVPALAIWIAVGSTYKVPAAVPISQVGKRQRNKSWNSEPLWIVPSNSERITSTSENPK